MSQREEALVLLRERFPEPWKLFVPDEREPLTGMWMVSAHLMHGMTERAVYSEALSDESTLSAARACIESWDEATKGERALSDRLAEALADCGEHQRGCPWARFDAGRPTESGGYEMQYAGQWYEVKPNDRRPACTCGLNEALAAHAERRRV